MNRMLHTPEGVRDIYGGEAAAKGVLERKLSDKISSFGYERIYTPSFEYFDVYAKETGSVASNELYKFFDREGNTLVLRPDITPQTARLCANYLSEKEMPLRLYYCANTYKNPSRLLGRLRESTQIGAEIIGEVSAESDAEIIALSCESMKASGLDTFQISIGHTGYFRALTSACGLEENRDSDLIDSLFSFILNKNFFGLDEKLKQMAVSEEIITLFSAMTKFYDSPDEWEELLAIAEGYKEVKAVLDYLSTLYDLLIMYGCGENISFELGLLTTLGYYTGIVFAGYTYGSGEMLLRGGRYDRLHSYFGGNNPAVGFGINEDELLLSLQRNGTDPAPGDDIIKVSYSGDNIKEAIEKAARLRASGNRAVIEKEEK